MYAIPCVTWVKKGKAKSHPDRVRLSEEELEELLDKPSTTKASDNTAKAAPEEGDHEESSGDEETVSSRYGLDTYGDSSGDEGASAEENKAFDVSSLAFYKSNKHDPNLIQEDASDDDADLYIEPDDNLVVIGKFSEDYSNLNAYVYSETSDYLYCHHDSLLPSLPLCMEWLDFDPGEEMAGNLVAVGGMEASIDIWDLDVLDTLEPAFTLRGAPRKKSKKKKLKSVHGHSDAVLDLSWNHHHRNVLASASADCTVGLWDLSDGQMVSSLSEHTDKVQSVEWHPLEAEMLLTGGFDHTVKIFDCRSPQGSMKSVKLSSEIEQVIWNRHEPYYFLVATEEGMVYYYDSRADKAVFTLAAHNSPVSGLALSPTIPGCLLTSSSDKSVKVWDIKNHKPATVFSKVLNIGPIHSLSACPDSDLLYAVGGERELRILNLKKQPAVASHFGLLQSSDSSVSASGQWEVHRADESASSEDDDVEVNTAPKKKKKKNVQKKSSNSDAGNKMAKTSDKSKLKKTKKKKLSNK